MRLMRLIFAGVFVGLGLACSGGTDEDDDDDDEEEESEVSNACANYLECLAAIDPTTLESVEATYGEGGTCWDDPTTAEQCTEACRTGLDAAGEIYPDEPACEGGGSGTVEIEGAWSFEQVSSEGECVDSGYGVQIWVMNLDIYAAGGYYEADGSIEFDVGSNTFETPVTFIECTLSGDTFNCPEVYAGEYDTYWQFGAIYADSGLDAVLYAGLGDGEGTMFCEDLIQLRGEQ